MTECTHTSEAMYSLRKAVGKGPRMWAGKISITDGDVLNTGFSTIEGASGVMVVDEDIDADTPVVTYSAVSGGQITLRNGKMDAYTNVETPGYILVVGTVR